MRYRNGREAKLGDHVIGTGYNLKGTLAGVVIGLVAGQDSCNIRISVTQSSVGKPVSGANSFAFQETATPQEPVFVRETVEYGATKDFLHIDDAVIVDPQKKQELCAEIEKLPASEQQTKVSLLASSL